MDEAAIATGRRVPVIPIAIVALLVVGMGLIAAGIYLQRTTPPTATLPLPAPTISATATHRLLAPTATTLRSTATPIPPVPTTPSIAISSLTLPIATARADLPAYNRREWLHWTDPDGDCQNTRHEVLIAQSQAAVTFKTERQCQVVSGQWRGMYTNTLVGEAAKLDVDHLVPLKNAHVSGGWSWGADRKRHYANSMHDPDHLIAVTAGANRAKGAKGPEEWRPPNELYWCEYASDWTRVKVTWGLTVTPPEASALEEMLATCPGQGAQSKPSATSAPVVTSSPLPPTAIPAALTAAPSPVATYASDLMITKHPGTVARGQVASVSVQASPDSQCQIKVIYKSGASKAAGLEDRKADADGVVSWKWKIGGRTSRGTWTVKILCAEQTVTTAVTVR